MLLSWVDVVVREPGILALTSQAAIQRTGACPLRRPELLGASMLLHASEAVHWRK